MYTKHMYTLHVYINTYIHGWSHRSRTDTQSTCEHRQHQQPHPVLSGWAGWRATSENVYISISAQWIPLAAGLRHSVCPVAATGCQSPQLLASGHTTPQAAALLQLVQTVTHTHARACVRAHTHTQSWLGVPWPRSRPQCSHPHKHMGTLTPTGGP